MKNIIIAGLLMAFAGSAMAVSTEGGSATDAEAQGNEYLAKCTEYGNEKGLQNEELEEFISSCIQDLSEKENSNADRDQG